MNYDVQYFSQRSVSLIEQSLANSRRYTLWSSIFHFVCRHEWLFWKSISNFAKWIIIFCLQIVFLPRGVATEFSKLFWWKLVLSIVDPNFIIWNWMIFIFEGVTKPSCLNCLTLNKDICIFKGFCYLYHVNLILIVYQSVHHLLIVFHITQNVFEFQM